MKHKKNKQKICAGLKPAQTIEQLKRVLDNDKNFKDSICFNELSNTLWVKNQLPWNKECNRRFLDSDISQLKRNMQNHYPKIKVTKEIMEDVFNTFRDERKYNPVKDYLKNLKWDGKKRIKDIPQMVFLQDPNVFDSEVFKILLLGAIHRIMEPGCKFDYMIILYGPQGCGKSTFFSKLAPFDYLYTDQIKIHTGCNSENKDIEQLQGKLICEFGELAGTKGASIEHIKSFLTRTSNTSRLAYERNAADFKVSQIFVGSTNNKKCLPIDTSGNRRFLIVDLNNTDKDSYDICQNVNKVMTPKYRNQLWAEALELYKNQTQCHLSKQMEKLAEERRETFEEKDLWYDLIKQFLNKVIEDMKQNNKTFKNLTKEDIYNNAISNTIVNNENMDGMRLVKNIKKIKEKEKINIESARIQVNRNQVRGYKLSVA